MSAAIRGKTAIVGIGSAGVGEAPGYSAIELLGQASLKAIADAGLKLSDIDAIFAATSSHAFPTLSVAEYLGIRPKFVDGTNIGGSSFELHLLQATLAHPLSAADCCLVTDGGGACVVVRAERARDLPNAPVYFLGAAGAQWHRSIVSMPDLTVTAASESGPRAMQMAGVRHADIDLVMLYDAFTINTLLFLEDLGFCAKGEGGPFVQGGRIAPGGELAVNTNGGGLSCVHPGMYGMFLIIEAVTQLRRQAGERQLAKADVALLHGNGGTLSSQVTALLGTGDTL